MRGTLFLLVLGGIGCGASPAPEPPKDATAAVQPVAQVPKPQAVAESAPGKDGAPVRVEATLNDGPTAQLVWDALPITARASRWGDEVYFVIPVQTGSEPDARAEVKVGELGYWPTGDAFCIFFGPTPASTGNTPAAASPVNILGAINGDATVFKAVRSGDTIRIEAGA